MNNFENNRPSRSLFPLFLVLIGLLLLGAVLTWQVLRMGQVQAITQPTEDTTSANSQIPAPEIKRVPLEEAKAAFDNQSAVFVDVRSVDSYNQAHIPGAINIPLADIENRTGELDPNQWIITYCT